MGRRFCNRRAHALLIVVYSTGHGFGHASRDLEVARSLARLAPEARLHVRTPVAPWFVASALEGTPHETSSIRLDAGIVQGDSLTQDLGATADACVALLAARETLLAGEIDFLRKVKADAVIADIPALPLAAAAHLGLPAIAFSNFTWSWIYRDLVDLEPRLAAVADAFDADYAAADSLFRLPFHGGDHVAAPFRETIDVSMVARRSTLDPDDAKRRLGVDPGQAAVLVSFGGLGPAALDIERLSRIDGFTFIVTPPGPTRTAPNVRVLDTAEMTARGLRYADLVRACDVVATKPGYGIVSECLANETRLLYTSRGRFAEYPVLVDAIDRYGTGAFIDNETLARGAWDDALHALMRRPRRPCALATDGADDVARRFLARIG